MLRCGDFDADEAYILPEPCEGEMLLQRAQNFRRQLFKEFEDLQKHAPELSTQIYIGCERVNEPRSIDITVCRNGMVWDRYRIF